MSGGRSGPSTGRGRGSRGRGLGVAAQLSSSSSSLSLSPERGETSQLAEDMEKTTMEESTTTMMFPHADLGPPPFNPDTDFPMARSGGLPCGGVTPEFYPPQSRLSGKFQGPRTRAGPIGVKCSPLRRMSSIGPLCPRNPPFCSLSSKMSSNLTFWMILKIRRF